MFKYESKLLKSSIAEGVVHSQFRMISLYSKNLNAVGTQAAFITTISYFSIQNALLTEKVNHSNYAWASQVLYAVSICSALIMVSHCILSSMFGPTKALVGNGICVNEIILLNLSIYTC